MSRKKVKKFTVKSCPFCGGKNMGVRYTPPYVQRLEYWITCFDCHSRTGYCKTPEDAVESWNGRVSEVIEDCIAELH